jgi:hypothetical protein
MDAVTVFAIQYSLSFVVYTLIVVWFVIPWVRQKHIRDAVTPLLFLHAMRSLGLTYLVPGVADPSLPQVFTQPTAYGDLVSAGLALVCLLALRYLPKTATNDPALLLVWVFNSVGLVDLVIAITIGLQVGILNYELGSMWYVPAYIVPALIVTHLALFWMLWKHHRGEWH